MASTLKSIAAWLSQRNKAVLGAIGVTLAWAQAVVASPAGPISAEEWLALGTGWAVGVFGVERVTNAIASRRTVD